jgi:transcription antitermination factor NusG
VDHLTFSPGDFVIVNAEPFGEDLGVVVEVLNERAGV